MIIKDLQSREYLLIKDEDNFNTLSKYKILSFFKKVSGKSSFFIAHIFTSK